MFSDIAKVQKKMVFQSVLKVYWITENGQNMAKIEKMGNIQVVDNKEDKFFYFPMISMAFTGSGFDFTPTLMIVSACVLCPS